MSPDKLLYQGLLIFILILVNAVFVIAEYAIVRVRASELEVLIKRGNLKAKRAEQVINNLNRYISATQLGITFVNLLLGWIGEDVFIHLLYPLFLGLHIEDSVSQTIAVFAGLLIITYFTITIGELAPKAFALKKYMSASLWLSYPLIIFYKIFKPFIWILNRSAEVLIRLMGLSSTDKNEFERTEEEIRQVIQEGTVSGVIDKTEQQLIEKIFDFNDKKTRDIMVPRSKMVSLNIEDSKENIIQKVTSEGFSRLPVYKDTIDNIIGVLYTKDLISTAVKMDDFDLKDVLRPPCFVPSVKHIGILLKEFQQDKVHMGIVINEFGGVEGLVTMEDIIEEIVGEIMDEYDMETLEIVKLKDNIYFIDPIISVKNFNEKFESDIPEDPYYNTIGGFLFTVTGHIPSLYERINYKNLTFTISGKTGNTIKQIKVSKKI